MLRYLVLDTADSMTTPLPPRERFQVHVWESDDKKPITHMDYIAHLAGVTQDVRKLKSCEKGQFIQTINRISSWGRISMSGRG